MHGHSLWYQGFDLVSHDAKVPFEAMQFSELRFIVEQIEVSAQRVGANADNVFPDSTVRITPSES